MRRIPKSKHYLAALIIVATAALGAYIAWNDDDFSQPQVDMACAAMKANHPDLFPGDPIFGSRIWQFHQSAFDVFLRSMPTSMDNPMLPFRILAGVLAAVFLAGMYALLYRQTRSWSVSIFVAVLSCTVTTGLGRSSWGVGPLATVTPQTVVLSVVPLIVLAFLNNLRRRELLLVFALIGLLGNVHLVMAMNLTLVLLLAYLGTRRFAPRAWLWALACGACALLASLPYLRDLLALKVQLAGQSASTQAVYQAFHIAKQNVLFPDLLKDLLQWELLARLAALVVGATFVLVRWERFRVQNRSTWAWMIAGAAGVTFGLQAGSQLLGMAVSGPPVIDFLRAFCLLWLPLYVLLAQGLTDMFRLVRGHPHLLRWACAGLLAIWMIPSDNLALPRHELYRACAKMLPEQPRRVRKLVEHQQRQQEIQAMADWARAQDSLPSAGRAIFITDRAEFRLFSRQSILAGYDDVRYVYYLCPGMLDEWVHRFTSQQKLLEGTMEPDKFVEFFAGLRDLPSMKSIRRWYVLFESTVPTGRYPGLRPIAGSAWGKHYRLYMYDPAFAATQSASTAATTSAD